jgi:hypothetical protein
MNTVESWENRVSKLDPIHAEVITGGGLSKRFSRLPLWLSHPANISAFYGLLVSLALILPYGFGPQEQWGALWILHASLLILACLVLGMISRLMSVFFKRMPVAPWRKILYPMPFVGFGCFTLSEVGLFSIPSIIPWTLILLPGPLYVHLSWAPRWRLLCMIEDEVDPFPGMDVEEKTDEMSSKSLSGEDEQLLEVVEEFDSEE